MNFLDGITYSQDEQLICLTNKDGIQIFDTKNFEMLLKLNQFVVGLQGDAYKAKIFNNSNIFLLNIDVFSFTEFSQLCRKLTELILRKLGAARNIQCVHALFIRHSIRV